MGLFHFLQVADIPQRPVYKQYFVLEKGRKYMGSNERDILMVMRKVLTSVIREITPEPGNPAPLSKQTTEGVRMCLRLIATRERELADENGASIEKPYYVDQPPDTTVVPMSSIKKKYSEGENDE